MRLPQDTIAIAESVKGRSMDRPTHTARRVFVTGLWIVAAVLAVVPAASAYIDPATTGMLFSALVAGLAATGTALTMFWSRIVGYFNRDREPASLQSE